MNFLTRLVSDPAGNISSSRFLNLLVGVCACLFCWKLVLMGGFTEGYFIALLAYGSGTYSFGKWVEAKSPPKEEVK